MTTELQDVGGPLSRQSRNVNFNRRSISAWAAAIGPDEVQRLE